MKGSTSSMPAEGLVQRALVSERRRLWGLCYRMSGNPSDADDWLQDACERALLHPPADLDRPLGPWLTAVTVNLCRDRLRKRKAAGYAGPWLPGGMPLAELSALLDDHEAPDARYSRMQSVSLAFLRALEILTETQRAVLILRDVMDLSVAETAQALELTEANVKTTLHRARAALSPPPPEHSAGRQREALQALMVHLATENRSALAALVSPEFLMLNDGAGKYFAARRPVVGLAKVLVFQRKTARLPRLVCMTDINGTPALLVDFVLNRPGEPPRAAVWVELDEAGRVRELVAVVADRKLTHLPWRRMAPPGPVHALTLVRAALGYRPSATTGDVPGPILFRVGELAYRVARQASAWRAPAPPSIRTPVRAAAGARTGQAMPGPRVPAP